MKKINTLLFSLLISSITYTVHASTIVIVPCPQPTVFKAGNYYHKDTQNGEERWVMDVDDLPFDTVVKLNKNNMINYTNTSIDPSDWKPGIVCDGQIEINQKVTHLKASYWPDTLTDCKPLSLNSFSCVLKK